MEMDKELEEYARECTRLASLTDDPTIREPLLKMARDWMEVARAERQRASRAKIRPQWSASASSTGNAAGPAPRQAEITGAH